MNRYHAAGLFTPKQVLLLKGFHKLAVGISRLRFVEFAFSMLAMFYGAGLAVFAESAISPVSYHPIVPVINNHPFFYGVLIALSGGVGWLGLLAHNKLMRLMSATFLAMLWAGLSWHFILAQPPFPLDFIFYAFCSAVEACIFIRVYADLDCYWHRR